MSYKAINNDLSGSIGGATTFLDTVTLEPTTDIAAPSGEDIQIQLGDAVGANKLIVSDSASTDVFAVDSDGSVQILDASNDGNPQVRLGATDAEELHIQSVYDSGAQTLDYVLFQTDVASATADKGEYRFNVDGTETARINDAGLEVDTINELVAAAGVTIDGLKIENDGTTTNFLGTAGDYLQVGDAAGTSHTLNSEDDLMVTGELEVDGEAFFDGALTISANTATITHSGTTSLSIASTSGTVAIESVVFTGGALSSATTLSMGGDLTNYEALNDGSPSILLGSSATERLNLQAVYNTGAQTIARVDFITSTASVTGDDGQFRFTVDDVAILDIDDGGIEVTGTILIGSGCTITGGTNTFNITNGTAVFDVAASSSLDVNANLTVESASFVNQDLTSDASPTFVGLSLSGAVSGITTLAARAVNPTIANTQNDVPLEVTQNDTTNNPVAASVTNTGTGNSLFINSDGNSVSLNIDSESTTADVVTLDGNTLTTGNVILATNTISGTALANRSAGNNLLDFTISRTDARTSGTTADDYDVMNITRTSVTTGSGGTLTAAGSVLRLANTRTQTDGTLTDTVNLLEMQADTGGTGYAILIGNE